MRIAITAMAGLFPGPDGPQKVAGFWNSVRQGRVAVRTSLEREWGIPRSRYFDPRPGTAYRSYSDWAFTVNTEPKRSQVELAVDVLNELLSFAGDTPLPPREQLALCAGTSWTDASYYQADADQVVGRSLGRRTISPAIYDPEQQLNAIALSAGLRGPRLAIDTACASSLYALEAAAGMIESGQAAAVAVLGLNAFLPPFLYLGFARLTALAASGDILPFSAHASGIVPAEAVAAILIEPEAQARAAGREVLAEIVGLGLSADGGERSVFAPGPAGQRLAYERAYQDLDPSSIDYVEAHGTATAVGDQTEITALQEFFGPHRQGRPLPIGSVKGLVGHSLASAGLVSVIKVLCMLRHGVIPPHLAPEPHPALRQTVLRLPQSEEPWPEQDGVRRAAISSFGFGGANAHLVLERSTPRPRLVAMPSRDEAFVPIAIDALHAVIGSHQGLAAIAHHLKRGTAPAPFPVSRFSAAETLSRAPEGCYFDAEVRTEDVGLRLGPHALKRMDPFQRLGVHSVQQALRMTPKVDLRSVGMVFCSNLGGETSLQLSRHYVAHFLGQGDASARYSQVEPALETIASALPSLTSGFPAYCLGLRGFHETVSGGPGSFWTALRLASGWLRHRCSSLILGAGRHIKSPLECQLGEAPQAEAVITFVLRAHHEVADATPIAVIRDFTWYEGDTNTTTLADVRARWQAELQNRCGRNATCFEVSQLGPAAGAGQTRFGWLNEAAGADALLAVLLEPGTGLRAIEIRKGEQIVAHLCVDKLREPALAELPLRSPGAAAFQSATQRPAGDEVVLPAVPLPFLAWQSSTVAMMKSYLAEQRRFLELLPRNVEPDSTELHRAWTRSVASLRQDPRNVVITDVETLQGDTGLGSMRARLVVDEGHPYFFDHPLDHVPGILLLEAVLQTMETCLPLGHQVSGLELNFRRFCEKDAPAWIHVQTLPRAESVTHDVRIVQEGAEIAGCQVSSAVLGLSPKLSASSRSVDKEDRPAPEWLHKLHQSNVLVGNLKRLRGDECIASLIPPEPGHILSEGSRGSYSLLYLLETARQFIMLIAHQVENIPLDMPMNLATIALSLRREMTRDNQYEFRCRRQPVQRIGRMVIAPVRVELHDLSGALGECTIKAQVVDHATYQRQRGFATSSRGARA